MKVWTFLETFKKLLNFLEMQQTENRRPFESPWWTFQVPGALDEKFLKSWKFYWKLNFSKFRNFLKSLKEHVSFEFLTHWPLLTFLPEYKCWNFTSPTHRPVSDEKKMEKKIAEKSQDFLWLRKPTFDMHKHVLKCSDFQK